MIRSAVEVCSFRGVSGGVRTSRWRRARDLVPYALDTPSKDPVSTEPRAPAALKARADKAAGASTVSSGRGDYVLSRG